MSSTEIISDHRVPTIFGADDGLLETLLTEVGVNVVGRAGRVTRLGIETGIPEQVAEVLENVQQLLGSIFEDSEHLERSGHKSFTEGNLGSSAKFYRNLVKNSWHITC